MSLDLIELLARESRPIALFTALFIALTKDPE